MKAGLTGPDMDQLVEQLVALGDLASPANNALTVQDLAVAIRSMQRKAGSPDDGVVSPTDLLWIGSPQKVASVDLNIGDAAAGGAPVWSTDVRLERATIIDVSLDASARKFNVDQSPVQFSVNADGSIADVAAFQPVALGGHSVSDLPTTVAGSLRLAEPILGLTVPASSIVSGKNGTCVIVANGSDSTTVAVKIVDSSVDAVFIDAALDVGAKVLVNPSAQASC
jgi:hypothetical protein